MLRATTAAQNRDVVVSSSALAPNQGLHVDALIQRNGRIGTNSASPLEPLPSNTPTSAVNLEEDRVTQACAREDRVVEDNRRPTIQTLPVRSAP
jgi:hypothetical protein